METRVCVAKIGAAHGLRGEVRLQVFTEDPDAVVGYGELESEDGTRKFRVSSLRPAKGHFIAKFEGVNDRNASELLTNTQLFVSREKLPEIEDAETFYHADLIGNTFGVVGAVRNYGAGDLIEVSAKPNAPGTLVPFIEQFVPEVDLKKGRVVIDPPLGLFDEPKAKSK
jgi:16S rRNA processing protein RimM